MALLGIGLDVADVSRFAALLERAGGRFRHRWFTEVEMRECDAHANPAAAYAARFAAKEAVWKALGQAGDRAVPWRCICVLTEGRQPLVRLAGSVADAATALGVAAITVSMTHAGGLASAFAVVEGAVPPAALPTSKRGPLDEG